MAAFNQWRKILILSGLHRRLGNDRKVQLVLFLTRTQQLLSILRIFIACAGATSLIWTLYLETKSSGGDIKDTRNLIPLYIALTAVVAGVMTVIFFFIVELSVGYGVSDFGARPGREYG